MRRHRMQQLVLSWAGLCLLGAVTTVIPTMAQPSETLPGVPQQNDRRSPISKLDPSKPIKLRIVNQSSVEVLAVLAEPTSRERKVLPQQSVTFGTLQKSFLPPPIDLTVYTNAKDTNLRAKISVVSNEMIVTVTSKPGTYGLTRSIAVDKSGSIYLY